jgi:hypothetical protein
MTLIKDIDKYLNKQRRHYIRPGQQAPKGMQVKRGKRGGMYYEERPSVDEGFGGDTGVDADIGLEDAVWEFMEGLEDNDENITSDQMREAVKSKFDLDDKQTNEFVNQWVDIKDEEDIAMDDENAEWWEQAGKDFAVDDKKKNKIFEEFDWYDNIEGEEPEGGALADIGDDIKNEYGVTDEQLKDLFQEWKGGKVDKDQDFHNRINDSIEEMIDKQPEQVIINRLKQEFDLDDETAESMIAGYDQKRMGKSLIKSLDNYIIKRRIGMARGITTNTRKKGGKSPSLSGSGRHYVKPGTQTPKGVQLKRGVRGGMYYEGAPVTPGGAMDRFTDVNLEALSSGDLDIMQKRFEARAKELNKLYEKAFKQGKMKDANHYRDLRSKYLSETRRIDDEKNKRTEAYDTASMKSYMEDLERMGLKNPDRNLSKEGRVAPSRMPQGPVKLVLAEDWFIYGEDPTGRVYFLNTELNPVWGEIPEEYRESQEGMKMVVDKLRDRWNELSWRPAIDDKNLQYVALNDDGEPITNSDAVGWQDVDKFNIKSLSNEKVHEIYMDSKSRFDELMRLLFSAEREDVKDNIEKETMKILKKHELIVLEMANRGLEAGE